jgi:hypothetical protein
MIVFVVKPLRQDQLDHPAWEKLTIANDNEAEIATEYGDGHEFRKGQTILHNHVLGRYQSAK